MTLKEFTFRYPEHAEKAEERAGIMEYSGNMKREKAEQWTVALLTKKYITYGQKEMF